MLQEAIYKFKASGPMLLPELIDNYWIGEIKAYEDYAILPYEVHIPQPIDKVIGYVRNECRPCHSLPSGAISPYGVRT